MAPPSPLVTTSPTIEVSPGPPVGPGQVIAGKYRLEGIIGEGGMGIVFGATHLQLDERVAIKMLKAEALARPDIVGRFAREARAAVKIKSEHVARVFDVGSLESGAPYMVMEFLEGNDLGAVIDASGPLALREAVEHIMQACDALSEAHSLGIVHRDIKPENLFLVRGSGKWSSIKVLDFGISKAALTGSSLPTESMNLTRTMSLLGSPLYMSPEQVRGGRTVDHRTDIWSLGTVLFELLTCKFPFPAESITELCAMVLEDSPKSLLALRPDLPPEIETIVFRCLQRDPELRYQNTAELAIDLLPFAPNRCRALAERASSVTRAGGLSRGDLRLPPSAPPPRMSSPMLVAPNVPPPEPDLPTFSRSSDPPSTASPASRRGLLVGALLVLGLIAAALYAGRRDPARATPVAQTVASPKAEPAKAEPARTEPPKADPAKPEPPTTETPVAAVPHAAPPTEGKVDAHPAGADTTPGAGSKARSRRSGSGTGGKGSGSDMDVGF